MRASAVIVALLSAAGMASAATGCAAKNIVDTCLRDYNVRLRGCAATDYICQCEEQKNLLKCYDNCPNIPERSTQEGTVTNICVAADQQRATMTTAAPKPTNTGDSTSEPTDDSSDSSTTSSSDAPAETTEAAADDAGSGAAGIAPMGIFGLLAGAAAVAAAF